MADIERWSKSKSYLAEWQGRAKIIAEYLKECNSVIDMGAGSQMLKPFIKGEYIPVDVVKIKHDTILIDFDTDWDIDILPKSDGIAIAGLLEHIKDPLGFIRKMQPTGKVWAVSYMDSRKHRHNLVTLEQLENVFIDIGMVIKSKTTWQNQCVYKLVRK